MAGVSVDQVPVPFGKLRGTHVFYLRGEPKCVGDRIIFSHDDGVYDHFPPQLTDVQRPGFALMTGGLR